MKCDRCDNEATIHLTQVLDGQVKKIHLCESCALEEGLDVNQTMSITDLLLGQQEGEAAPFESDLGGTSCPRCHLTRTDFKKSGRLGCPHCYEHFAKSLKPLLKAVQHHEQHVGKIPSRESARVRQTAELAVLKKGLDRAIADEKYEEAALLRDKIRAVEQAAETAAGDEQ